MSFYRTKGSPILFDSIIDFDRRNFYQMFYNDSDSTKFKKVPPLVSGAIDVIVILICESVQGKIYFNYC